VQWRCGGDGEFAAAESDRPNLRTEKSLSCVISLVLHLPGPALLQTLLPRLLLSWLAIIFEACRGSGPPSIIRWTYFIKTNTLLHSISVLGVTSLSKLYDGFDRAPKIVVRCLPGTSNTSIYGSGQSEKITCTGSLQIQPNKFPGDFQDTFNKIPGGCLHWLSLSVLHHGIQTHALSVMYQKRSQKFVLGR